MRCVSRHGTDAHASIALTASLGSNRAGNENMATRQIAVAESFSRERGAVPKRHLDDFSRHGLEFASVAMGVIGFVMFIDAMSGGGLRNLCSQVAMLLTRLG